MNNWFTKMDNWSKTHHPKWMDALRILLGIIIHLKTLIFIAATARIILYLESLGYGDSAKFLVYTVTAVQLIAGSMILLGLQTRIATLVVFPVLLASVIFSLVHSHGFALSSELLLSFIILFMLIFFFIEGSGTFSVDQYIRNSYKSTDPDRY